MQEQRRLERKIPAPAVKLNGAAKSARLKNAVKSNASEAVGNGRMTGEERRKQLIRVAIQLFSQKGFRGTTTKDIAVAARVNEAMIFRHFARKEDLYAAILDYKASETCAGDWLDGAREAAKRNDDDAVFHLMATRILAHYRADRDFLRLMLYSALEGHELTNMFRDKQVCPVYEFMIAYIKRRQRAGVFRACNPSAAVRGFLGMSHHHGMISALFCDVIKISDKVAIENFTNLMLGGLRAKEVAGERRIMKAKTTSKKPRGKIKTT